MGLPRLLGFCLTFFPVLALAAGPVSTEVAAGTTTYRITGQTLNVPRISQLSSSKDITPRIQKLEVGPVYRDGGLGQTASGRLIIATPEESATARISGRFNVSGAGLKTALKTAAGAATGAGLVIGAYELGSTIQTILDATEWTVLENGDLMRAVPWEDPLPPSGDTIYWNSIDVDIVPLDNFPTSKPEWATTSSPQSNRIQPVVTAVNELPSWTQREVRDVFPCSELDGYYSNYSTGRPNADHCIMLAKQEFAGGLRVAALVAAAQLSVGDHLESPWTVGIPDSWSALNFSYSNSRMWSIKSFPLGETDPNPPPEPQLVPVTPAEFDAAVDAYYDPSPSDWDVLFPHFPASEPSSFHVSEPVPMEQPDPKIETETVGEDTYVTETQVNFDPTVSGNDTPQPSISLQRGESYEKYLNGVLVSSGSTQQNYRPPSPEPGDSSGDGSGGGMFPPFCSWATIICDWIGWTQSDDGLPPEDPNEDIFAGIDLNEFDLTAFETVDMSFGGGASCPEPIQIDITFLNRTVELTYDSWCSLADTARLLVLAVAWMSAVSIIIGGIRRS